jgi:hypothetical protein
MDSNNPLGEQSPDPVVRKDQGRVILHIQSGLAISATRLPNKRFHNLHPLLWRREWLNSALEAVLDNTGAETSGVDGCVGQTCRQLQLELHRQLRQLEQPSASRQNLHARPGPHQEGSGPNLPRPIRRQAGPRLLYLKAELSDLSNRLC